MFKKSILFIGLILISFLLNAENKVDSLLNEISISIEIEKAAKYLKLAELIAENDPKQAENYALKALELAKKYTLNKELFPIHSFLFSIYKRSKQDSLAIHHKLKTIQYLTTAEERAAAYKEIGLIHFSKSQYILTEQFFYKQLNETLSTSDTNLLANNYFNIAYLNLLKNDFAESLSYYHKALELYEILNDQLKISNTYNDLGIVFRKLKQFDTSLDYLKKAEKLKEQLNDEFGLANVYTNRGNVYYDLEENEMALNSYHLALDIRNKRKHNELIISSLNNIANVHSIMENYSKAHYFYNEAYKKAKEIGSNYYKGVTSVNLGVIYNSMGRYTSARPYLLEAEKIIYNMDNDELKQAFHQAMKVYYENTKQASKALSHLNSYYKISIKIIEKRNKSLYAENETKLTYEINELKNKVDKLEKNAAKYNLYYKTFLTLFIVFVSSVMVFFFFFKHKMKNS